MLSKRAIPDDVTQKEFRRSLKKNIYLPTKVIRETVFTIVSHMKWWFDTLRFFNLLPSETKDTASGKQIL